MISDFKFQISDWGGGGPRAVRARHHVIRHAAMALLCAVSLGFSAEYLPTEIAPAKAHVGDPINLKVTLRFKEGAAFSVPPLGEKLGDLDVLSHEIGEVQRQPDGSYVQTVTYQLTAYKPGKFTIPSVQIKQTAPQAMVLPSQPGEVEIVTILTGKETDIEDIKSPMTIPFEVQWMWVLALALAALALAALVWWLRRGKRAGGGLAPLAAVPQLSPEEEALEALKRLEASSLLVEGRIKEFYVELTEILKHYVYRRHGVAVEERTTDEIVRDSSAVLPSEVFQLLREFLRRADMVKFAKYRAAAEETREMVKWTYRIVEVSRPLPETTGAAKLDAA
ncbi:MAG: BatD family protein [Acidobacteriota bacterium]